DGRTPTTGRPPWPRRARSVPWPAGSTSTGTGSSSMSPPFRGLAGMTVVGDQPAHVHVEPTTAAHGVVDDPEVRSGEFERAVEFVAVLLQDVRDRVEFGERGRELFGVVGDQSGDLF